MSERKFEFDSNKYWSGGPIEITVNRDIFHDPESRDEAYEIIAGKIRDQVGQNSLFVDDITSSLVKNLFENIDFKSGITFRETTVPEVLSSREILLSSSIPAAGQNSTGKGDLESEPGIYGDLGANHR